jgi:NTP pyrophosphatase (non-canonical NTP hydrolase)
MIQRAPRVGGMKMDRIVNEVLHEVARATTKFPTWPSDPLHAAAIVQEECGELVKATLHACYEPHKSTVADVREEAIQTAAMVLRFLISLDDYDFKRGPQHKQCASGDL